MPDRLQGLPRGALLAEVERLRAVVDRDKDEQASIRRYEADLQRESFVEAQHILEASRDRYADLYDYAPLPYVTLDRNGVILDINLTGAEFFERLRRAILGHPFMMCITPACRRAFLEHLRRCRAGESPLSVALELATPRGRIPVELHTRRMVDDNGDGVFRAAVVDLSAQREAEAAKEQALAEHIRFVRKEERMRAASEAKDKFLATLSHELRTPLAPALTALAVLERRSDVPGDLRPMVSLIRRNLQLEARLVDDLLDLTRVTQGRLQMRMETMDVHDAIREALETCASDAPPGITSELALNADHHHVKGDPTRLRQVFWNVIRNAYQHTPAGGRIRVATENGSDGNIRIAVEDTGTGIAPQDMERIFAPFQQGGEEKRPGTGAGLGLGLAICRSIVEAHGGTITVASGGPGRGARFEVTFPETAAADGTPGNRGRGRAASRRARRVSVLLVEDHADAAQALAEALEIEGYHVTIARSLAQARDRLRDGPDVIISDVGLPDGSGLDLFRDAGPRKPSHTIALSGFGTEQDVQRAREAGFELHLTKPVDLELLLEKIRQFVSGDRASAKADRRNAG